MYIYVIENIYFGPFVNLFPNRPWFLHVCSTNLLKALWEKEKMLMTSNFSFSQSVFYPSEEFSAIFIKSETVFCKFFQFGSLKFVIWKRVNLFGNLIFININYPMIYNPNNLQAYFILRATKDFQYSYLSISYIVYLFSIYFYAPAPIDQRHVYIVFPHLFVH